MSSRPLSKVPEHMSESKYLKFGISSQEESTTTDIFFPGTLWLPDMWNILKLFET